MSLEQSHDIQMVSRAKGSSTTMAVNCNQAKNWVKMHYERHEEGVVAKSVMYKHYEEECRDEGRNIMETSIFGRVVKSVFPDVTIRRLGGRDNLKYYYCGIRAKETSPYAIDNSTTTRPKRSLRKRELVTDKMEVHNCLRWLHANYVAWNDASVVKTDVYDGYLNSCKPRGVEPLSIQYFGMVVTHAFPNVTKRKLGPRTNQQKYYFGLQKRPNPMALDLVPCEILSNFEEVFRTGTSRSSYRETIDNAEEEDESCRSPASDLSDISSSQHNLHPVNYDSEMRSSPHLHQYTVDPFLKEDTEPVDYSLSSLRLKDEPIEEEILIKEEPLDLHIARDTLEERRTPERPPSVSAFASHSPSPPNKDSRTRRIYKPRFHYHYDDSPWGDDPGSKIKREEGSDLSLFESQSGATLRQWLLHNFEESKGVHVNRDQVYELYEKYCDVLRFTVLPMTSFDETVLKVFRDVVTMIHPSGKTFYEGIRVQTMAALFGRVEELCQEDPPWGEEETTPNSIEMSPPTDGSTSQSSPYTLDEEEAPEEGFQFHCAPIEDDLHATPEVLRDGKFYLKKWLMDNFNSVPDSCVLKADAYRHYDAYARSIHQTPFEMNVFGKIVRQVFPKVSIRRLGGRVKPQYHYCGIAVKPSSPLHHLMSGKDPAQRSRKKEIATDNRSAEVVLDFLRCNYDSGKEKIIMKSEVFDNYCAFCASLGENPVTLNYFGKLVKHCFPSVEVRKFGGRSEPTWYYFGMVPRGVAPVTPCAITTTPSPLSSCSPHKYMVAPTYPEEAAPHGDTLGAVLHSGVPRHPTSPIPISAHRPHLNSPTPLGSYGGSPSTLLNSHLQASLRVSSYEDHSQGSPAEGTSYFRESMTSHSPAAEVCYSRSPVDACHGQGQLYPVVTTLDAIYPRETIQGNHKPMPYLGGGQVVPSQTPPSLSIADHPMGIHLHKKARCPPHLAPHEDYEMFNDLAME